LKIIHKECYGNYENILDPSILINEIFYVDSEDDDIFNSKFT